eukprot:TRINITY_DN17307_c0_g1_i1.p3 TRINITY_DN17307_c0_g1~~TRINITY_DN17307_c0_g1_i1.p3  ORF type:complete len:210 (+),score=51.72 TRINITY_DN17307_c0_g1_i1:259-888(+)
MSQIVRLVDVFCQGAWGLLRRVDWMQGVVEEFLGDELGPSGMLWEGELSKDAKKLISENLMAQMYRAVFRMLSLLAQQFPEMLVGFLCRKSLGWWLISVVVDFVCGDEPQNIFKNSAINPFVQEPAEYPHPIVWQTRKYLEFAVKTCDTTLLILAQDVRSARKLVNLEERFFEALQRGKCSQQIPQLLQQQQKTIPTVIENNSMELANI